MDEEEEYFNSRVPVIHEDRKHHKAQNKQVLLNLGIFALLTAVSSLLFMGWLAKKSRTQQNILPFHNPMDRSQLLCPLNTSFDTTKFSCMACSNNCEHCYHEYERRCLQCVHPYKLEQNECVEECISVDGVCVNELEPSLFNYSVENLGTELRVNQLFQVEIHNQQQEHVYIVFPPLGQSFNYFYSTVNFFQLAKQLNGTIYIFSTPYTEVLQIQQVQEDDQLPEQFRYVERVFQYVNESLISTVKSINIVALGDMLFFAHELSTLIVRSGLDVNTTVYLLQNSEIQLQESLNLSYLKLQHLLAYIDQGWDISHKENKTNLIAENVDDLSTILQEFLQKMNFNSLIKPSYNMKVDVVVLSEKGCRDIRQLYDDGFNAKEFKQIFLDSGNLQILFSKLIMLNRNS